MTYPVPFEVTYSYTSFAQGLGDGSFPGTQLDQDFADFGASLAAAITFLDGITRSDGALKNGIVTTDSLDTTLAAAFGDVASLAIVTALIATANADVVLTHADVVLTHADVVLTHADVVLTHADAASTAANVAALKGTSTTSVLIATGAKSFTTQLAKLFVAGQYLQIASNASALNFMHGTVTSYNAGTGALVMNITDIGGSGTLADWNISISGTQGPIGTTGATGPAGPVVDKSVRVATTANGTLATAFANGQTVDGVVLATGNLIMLKNQSAPAENGVYVVAASGAPARDDDYDTYNEHPGALVSVHEGTVNADTIWLCTSNLGGTLNSTAIVWAQYNATASNTVAGITKVSTSASAATGSATDEALRVADAAANFIGQGLHLIGVWNAGDLVRPTTTPAAVLAQLESTTNKVNDEYLGFVNASTTYAGLSFRAPKSSDESASLVVEFEWTEASGAAAHVCRWQAEAQAQSDADTIDAAWGTAVAVDDTGTSGTRRFCEVTVTPAGSWAAGDKIHIRVGRLGAHANDTLDVDARLLGVTVHGTINAKNDV